MVERGRGTVVSTEIAGTGSDEAKQVDVDAIIGLPPAGRSGLPNSLAGWLTTTDHKALGVAYAVTAFMFAAVGGVLSGIMRTELARPGLQFVDESTYNQLFTMHGSVMVYLFAVPFGFALANYLVPLQIGAPDLAFPRLNAFAYWMYLIGGLTMLAGFLTDGGAAGFGWFAYAPLSGPIGSPGLGPDLWIVSIIVTGTSGTLTAVNVIATVVTMRTPGMTMFRLPILVWNILLTNIMVLLVFPVFSGALMLLLADRRLDTHFFDPVGGGSPILWQHLFWFFGHPEVYIVALPFFGVVTEIFPVFSRRPIFGYKGLIIATISISALSTSVWAHHMFVTGSVYLPFFATTSFLIAVPTGVKVFNWTFTMWGGSLSFDPPMLFAIGFLVTFVGGGLTGVMLASPTLDFALSDSYFLVAHFHYVMGGTVVFAVFAAIWFWWPKVTGRMLPAWLGHVQFWLLLIGFNMTFFVMHLAGLAGMPRRVADYEGFDTISRFNLISSLGLLVIVASTVPFFAAVVISLRGPRNAGADPWQANSLEWATSSPPPEHNFKWLPPIRSERPVFDLRWVNHPRVGATGVSDAWRHRQNHDEHWFPLHPWIDSAAEEPRGTTPPDLSTGDQSADDPSERPT